MPRCPEIYRSSWSQVRPTRWRLLPPALMYTGRRRSRARCSVAMMSSLRSAARGALRRSVMPMPGGQGPVLLTAFENGHALAGVEGERRVEGVLDVLQLQQFCRTELIGHHAQLFHNHAVLAGDTAA